MHFLIRLQLVSHWIRCTTSCPAPWILGHENDFTSYAHSVQLVRILSLLRDSNSKRIFSSCQRVKINSNLGSCLAIFEMSKTCPLKFCPTKLGLARFFLTANPCPVKFCLVKLCAKLHYTKLWSAQSRHAKFWKHLG